MSNLKEQYDALIAAGMPEHERLYWRSWICEAEDKSRWQIEDGEMGARRDEDLDSVVNETDARDLITCHALRWLTVAQEGAPIELCLEPDGSKWEIDCSDQIVAMYGLGDTILDAIVKAVTQ